MEFAKDIFGPFFIALPRSILAVRKFRGDYAIPSFFVCAMILRNSFRYSSGPGQKDIVAGAFKKVSN